MLFSLCVVLSLDLVSSQECTSGFAGDENFKKSTPSRALLPIAFDNAANKLYIYPSLTFTCGGVITGVRMVMPGRDDQPITRKQEIFLTISVFSGSAVSDVIVLRKDDVMQTQGRTTAGGTATWMNREDSPLSTSVKAGDFIGLAIPRDNITGRSINYQGVAAMNSGLLLSARRLILSYNSLSEFVERVEESTAESGQTIRVLPPLIQFTVEPTPSSATPLATPTATSPSPPIDFGPIIGGAVGGVVAMVIMLSIAIIAVVVLVKCCRSSDVDHTPNHTYDYPYSDQKYDFPLQPNPSYITKTSTIQVSEDYAYV